MKTGSVNEFCTDTDHAARTCNACWDADHSVSSMETSRAHHSIVTELFETYGPDFCSPSFRDAILEALRTVEREALEKAAKVAEDYIHHDGDHMTELGRIIRTLIGESQS